MKKQLLALLLLLIMAVGCFGQSAPVVLAYFPSWSENWTTTGKNSKLREIPGFVNYVFLAFAKPNLAYQSGSYDISNTGIEVPYDGCTLKESISALNDKGIKVILSIGGESYWGSPGAYNINYQQIKALVDDIGFNGIDWDFEPNGSFANIGNEENVQHFIDFINRSRELMPADSGYIIACAPSGVGALGGQVNNDSDSPYSFENRNTLTGETDNKLYDGAAVTNGINLFGFSATGHMIPIMKTVGDKIDLIAYQGYNVGGSANRTIMYDSFAWYAKKFGFKLAAGVHYPNEPWGPYYEYTPERIAALAGHVAAYSLQNNRNDGVMIWQLLGEGANSSAYSYLNIASRVLIGESEANALKNSGNYSLSTYLGGALGCDTTPVDLYCGVPEYNVNKSYASSGMQVYYACKIWHNQWYANPGEIPGENDVWLMDSDCAGGEGCATSVSTIGSTVQIGVYYGSTDYSIRLVGLTRDTGYQLLSLTGAKIKQGSVSVSGILPVDGIPAGVYLIKMDNGTNLKIIKN